MTKQDREDLTIINLREIDKAIYHFARQENKFPEQTHNIMLGLQAARRAILNGFYFDENSLLN